MSKRPGPVVLVERVADRRDAVVHRKDEDAVAVAVERLARPHLDELERVGELAEDPAQRRRRDRGGRAARRSSAAARAARSANVFSIPGQAEVVVGVEVREEDLARGRAARPSSASAGAGCPRRSRRAGVRRRGARAAPRARGAGVGRCPRCRGRRGRGPSFSDCRGASAPATDHVAASARAGRASGPTRTLAPCRWFACSIRQIASADVAAVVLLRDRPERVVGLDRTTCLAPCAWDVRATALQTRTAIPAMRRTLTNMCSPC